MYSFVVFLFSLLFCVTLTISSAEFPKDIKKCKYGDGECIKNDINLILENKQQGYPQLGLPSINPLKVKSIDINQSKDKSIYLNIKYIDNTINLGEHMRVTKVNGFGKDPKGPHEIYMKGKSISLIGPYESSGKMVGIDLKGKGNQNLTITDVDLKVVMTGKPIEKNGKTYLQIHNTKLSFDVSRMYSSFDNLIGGDDKSVNNILNTFLNENWKPVFDELKIYYFNAFSQIFEAIINEIMKKFPYDELFLPE